MTGPAGAARSASAGRLRTVRDDRGAAAPLSFAQERMWLLDRLLPARGVYNVPATFECRGHLDVTAFRQCLAALMSRHEQLRASFPAVDGRPAQVIVAGLAEPPLAVHDLRNVSDSARQRQARVLAARLASAPFQLDQPPVWRADLIRLADLHHILLLTCHHIIADNWSLTLLLNELAELCQAAAEDRPPRLGPPPPPYTQFAAWQRNWLDGARLGRELGYWRAALKGAPQLLALPADRPRPPVASYRGAVVEFALPAREREAVLRRSRELGVTPFVTLLAAFTTLLYRDTGQADIVVGTPVTSRPRPDLESVVGYFSNMLALRIDLDGDPPFAELLKRAQMTTLDALDHQDLPFERLVQELAPQRGLDHHPIFQVQLALAEAPRTWQLPGLAISALPPARTGTAKFDLALLMSDGGDVFRGTIEYATDLFDRATISRMAGHLRVLLAAAGARPATRLSRLPLLMPAERRAIVTGWSTTAVPARRSCVTLHGRFTELARVAPSAPAVSAPGQRLSYAELDQLSDRLAAHLAGLGIGPGDRVGALLDRSADFVIAALGIVKAGAAYVPIDPAYPPERAAWILADSAATGLVTVTALADRVPQRADPDTHVVVAHQVIFLDQRPLGSRPAPPTIATPGPQASECVAYVMYTSGSTGQPKGVAVPHRAVARLAQDPGLAGIGPGDRVAFGSNVGFDAASFEVWATLLRGGTIVIPPRETLLRPPLLAGFLRREAVTVMCLTPALFHLVAAELPAAFAGLRCLLVGGDALDPERARAVIAAGPPARLLNCYGPTETATYAIWHEVRDIVPQARTVPIGRSVAGDRAYILNRELGPVPVGVTGELYLSGLGLAHGYHRRPALTAERFVPDPFGSQPGTRMYRTGDLARWLPDSVIDFVGRADRQVKIRGFRVEPAEVEAYLRSLGTVADAAVTCHGNDDERHLVAYVVPAGRPPGVRRLRTELARLVPSYMIPAKYVVLRQLPLTPNRKVDYRALPAPQPARRTAGRAPGSDLERRIAVGWREVLRRDAIGAEEDFFDLGGNSLLAVRLVTRVGDAAGVEVPLSALFEHPTIAGLAEQVRQLMAAGAAPAAPVKPVPRVRSTGHPPVPADGNCQGAGKHRDREDARDG